MALPKKKDNDKWLRELFGPKNKDKTRFKQIKKAKKISESIQKSGYK